MDGVTQLISAVGFPIAAAFGMGFAIWRAAVWIAIEFVKPMADVAKTHLANVDKELAKQSQANEQIVEQLKGINEKMLTVCAYPAGGECLVMKGQK